MTDDERLQKLKDDYRDAPIAQIEYELGRRLRGSDEYEVLHSLLNEARAAADAPEQQRHRGASPASGAKMLNHDQERVAPQSVWHDWLRK